MSRFLRITRDKTPIAWAAKYYVSINGKTEGWLKNGDSVNIRINDGMLTTFFVWSDFKGIKIKSEMVEIPDNDLNYHYHIKTSLNVLIGEVELYQDPEQEKTNIEITQKRFEVANIALQVEPLISAEVQNKRNGNRDFNYALSQIPSEVRNSPTAQSLLKELYDSLMDAAGSQFFDPTRFIPLIEDISTIKEYESSVYVILRNKGIIGSNINRIKSVFLENEDFSVQLEQLKKKYLKEFSNYTIPSSIINKYIDKVEKVNNAVLKKDYKTALTTMMFGDGPFEDFTRLKELYVFQSVFSSASKEDIINDRELKLAYNTFVSPLIYTEDGNDYTYGETVDSIIAKTIVYSKAGITDNVKNDLLQLLDTLCGSMDVFHNINAAFDTSQFELLRKVFEYYKAYNLEVTVIEKMYEHNIPRTDKQERRLAFLKKGKPDHNLINTDENTTAFLYDYRGLQWKDSDIQDYYEAYSLNSRRAYIPMVFHSFEKSVSTNKNIWDINKISQRINKTVIENLGLEYLTELVEAKSVLDDNSNTLSAVLIRSSSNSPYPWLGFLIIGDQMLLRQVSISIYSLYIPMRSKNNEVEDNQYNEKQLLIAKNRQNPRLNNFIELITNVLIESIEEWINQNNINNDLYD